jgi:ribonuclease III
LALRNILKDKYSPEQETLAKALYNIFGLKSRNIYIYELAFRHKSVAAEVKTGVKDSYERLEFLGDAILGAVVAEYLFKKYPFKSEGFLTDLRSKIVCGKFLSKIAQKLGLEKLISIQNHSSLNMVVSALCDVMEAVIGAMFIDKGFEFTRKTIIERIIDIHIDVEALVETETNFKSRLIEWAQKEKSEIKFELKDTKTVKNQKQYSVQIIIGEQQWAEAIHNSIKESEQLAAEKTIEMLKEAGRY